MKAQFATAQMGTLDVLQSKFANLGSLGYHIANEVVINDIIDDMSQNQLPPPKPCETEASSSQAEIQAEAAQATGQDNHAERPDARGQNYQAEEGQEASSQAEAAQATGQDNHAERPDARGQDYQAEEGQADQAKVQVKVEVNYDSDDDCQSTSSSSSSSSSSSGEEEERPTTPPLQQRPTTPPLQQRNEKGKEGEEGYFDSFFGLGFGSIMGLWVLFFDIFLLSRYHAGSDRDVRNVITNIFAINDPIAR